MSFFTVSPAPPFGIPVDVLGRLTRRPVRSDAEFILLVEKEAAYMRMAEDRFYQKYPCIVITAKGQPVRTRFCFFAQFICTRFILRAILFIYLFILIMGCGRLWWSCSSYRPTIAVFI